MMKTQKHGGVVRNVLAAVAFAGLLTAAAPAASVPIAVNFDEALSSTGIPRTLPFELNSTAQTLFLRFLVPDAPRIQSINSMSLTVTLHDESPDAQEENAGIAVRLPAPFFEMFVGFTDSGDLQGTTAGAPFIFTHSLTAGEIDDFMVAGALENGAFRLQVVRCCGDFVVVGGSVTIDANLAALPEPGSLALLAAAFGVFVLRRTRAKL
jgi:hypothetical protein